MADWNNPNPININPSGDTVLDGFIKTQNNFDDIYTRLNILKKLQASNTAPLSPAVNEFWFDTSANILKFWNGNEWKSFSIPLNVLFQNSFVGIVSDGFSGQPTNQGELLVASDIAFSKLSFNLSKWKVNFPIVNDSSESKTLNIYYWITTSSSYIDIKLNNALDFGYYYGVYDIRLSGSGLLSSTAINIPPGRHILTFKAYGPYTQFYCRYTNAKNIGIKPDWNQIIEKFGG